MKTFETLGSELDGWGHSVDGGWGFTYHDGSSVAVFQPCAGGAVAGCSYYAESGRIVEGVGFSCIGDAAAFMFQVQKQGARSKPPRDHAEAIRCVTDMLTTYVGMGFHPDTPATDYVFGEHNQPTFTIGEAALIDLRIAATSEHLLGDIYEATIIAAEIVQSLNAEKGNGS